MARALLLSVAIVVGSWSVKGQTASDSIRSTFIEQYPDRFFIWPVLKRRSLSFQVGPRAVTNQSIRYKPNNSFSTGIGLYLFEVAAEITVAIPINERSEATYGTTTVRDFRVNMLGKSGGLDAFVERYKGFYYEDGRSRIVKRADIQLTNTGVNGIYVWNKNRFSLVSAYNFSERQLKSGGSLTFTGNLNTFRLTADSVIRLHRSVGNPPGLLNMRSTTLSLAPGYSYSFVYRSFFLNGTFSIGPAHHWILYHRLNEKTRYDITINTYYDARLALGYNSDRIFGGFTWVVQSRNVRFDEIAFSNRVTNIRFIVGYRFRETGVLKQRAKDYVPVHLKK
jgi:hypothetical protein